MFMLRFDMRAPSTGAPLSELYRTALEMTEWAEEHGCARVMVSEHHASSDSYLPSPMVLTSAMASRTSTLQLAVGALLLNFYDPIKLAEDMAVLDIISGGRVSYTVGLGYRPEEHEMFGVKWSDRGAMMDRKLGALLAALSGESFEYEGRTVQVAPKPISPNGISIAYGGHSLAAARRAGRFGLHFFAEGGTDALVEAYHEAADDAGVTPGFAYVPQRGMPTSVFIAKDVNSAWRDMGPYLLHDAAMYREWMGANMAPSSRSEATTVDELRAENGAYRILTFDEAVAQIKSGVPLAMQPLCGGMPADLAWPSVRLAAEAAASAVG